MAKLRTLSGDDLVKVFGRFGFSEYSQRGSHLKLRRQTPLGRQTLTIPLHPELDKGDTSNNLSASAPLYRRIRAPRVLLPRIAYATASSSIVATMAGSSAKPSSARSSPSKCSTMASRILATSSSSVSAWVTTGRSTHSATYFFSPLKIRTWIVRRLTQFILADQGTVSDSDRVIARSSKPPSPHLVVQQRIALLFRRLGASANGECFRAVPNGDGPACRFQPH